MHMCRLYVYNSYTTIVALVVITEMYPFRFLIITTQTHSAMTRRTRTLTRFCCNFIIVVVSHVAATFDEAEKGKKCIALKVRY